MRKYLLILLLSFSAFSQSGLIARQNFGTKINSLTTNTEIGGVASTISTPALLASKLAIDVSRITNFSIVGSDIKCKITGTYSMDDPGTLTVGFGGDSNITYFRDNDNLLVGVGNYIFWNCPNLTELKVEGLLSIENSIGTSPIKKLIFPLATSVSDFKNNPKLETLFIPLVTSLGSTSGNNDVFGATIFSAYIYAHPSLATNNVGAPDGDLAYAISQGATVRYVSNFTVPNPITTLTNGTIYDTSIQLNFTPPSSTNTIDYYECYANGILKNTITTSGQYITGLTASTSYNITVVAVDIFYNKSVISNSVSASTNTNSWLNHSTIASYSLSDGVDAKNGYNGTVGAAVSFSSGVFGNCANLNNTTNSSIVIPDNSAFSFLNGSVDASFSVKMNVKQVSAGDQTIATKRTGTDEWQIAIIGGKFQLKLYDGASFIQILSTQNVSLNTFYNLIVVDYGETVNNASRLKMFINGVAETTTYTSSGSYVKKTNSASTVTLGKLNESTTGFGLNGQLDELYFFNINLTQNDINYLQSNFYPF